jgi:hypothetical protein
VPVPAVKLRVNNEAVKGAWLGLEEVLRNNVLNIYDLVITRTLWGACGCTRAWHWRLVDTRRRPFARANQLNLKGFKGLKEVRHGTWWLNARFL